jgi:O-antigen ligase
MRNLSAKYLMIPIIVGFIAIAFYAAYSRPGYFTDLQLVGGLFFLQALLLIVWRFEQRFFPVLVLIFLAAGTETPFGGVWSSVRWIVLAVGSIGGMMLYLKKYRTSFGTIHLLALICCLSAFVSSIVSNSPGASAGKAVSLLLLFLFGAGGARLVIGGNTKFPNGLLAGCEFLVYFTAICYVVFGYEFFGNANSLGAVMGIVAMPVLLWGIFIADTPGLRLRRGIVLLLALLFCLDSYSRASISAGLISCLFLCVGLRRYRPLVKGLVIVAIAASVIITFRPLESGQKADTLVDAFVYKGRPDEGILASRKTPWDETISSIQQSPWFGTGFGTSFLASSAKQRAEALRSFAGTSREHGNSYLAIAEWVGLLGIIPFAGLIFLTLRNVIAGFLAMRSRNNTSEIFIPICAVVLAGMIGAFFEDWMFAVGSYLCVFFWSFAFALHDLLPVPKTSAATVVDANAYPIASWNAEFGIAVSRQ